jgi:hypothetical protein
MQTQPLPRSACLRARRQKSTSICHGVRQRVQIYSPPGRSYARLRASNYHHEPAQLQLMWRRASGTPLRARRACISFAFSSQVRLLRGVEGLAVGLKRPAPRGPLVKQRRIVLQLQQRGSNMLGFGHFFFRDIKAGFFEFAFGICYISHPPDISIAHMESSCADIQDVAITHLRAAGEGNDAAQICFRAIFWVVGARTVRTVLRTVTRNCRYRGQV